MSVCTKREEEKGGREERGRGREREREREGRGDSLENV